MFKKFFICMSVFFMVFVMIVFDSIAAVEFKYGGSLRLRQELWENAFDLDTLNIKNENFFRLRTSLWGQLNFDKNLSTYLKLTNEARYFINSRTPNNNSFDEDELVIDNLYADYKNFLNLPVDIRIGRQDFLFNYGEGFLIMDGTPADGSRTFYFNAIKVAWKINENNNIDFVFLSNPIRDIYLPSLYATNKRRLNTSDELGFFIYSKNKISDNLTIEPYYIYKKEDKFSATPELDINTIGMRAVYKLDKWRFRAEFAHQFGEYEGGRDRRGNGGYIFAGKKYDNVTFKPEFDLGLIYMSGDKPSTTKHEGWNPLFSRWPIYSELIVFTLVNETLKDSGGIPAYWTNMIIFRANFKLNFSANTNLNIWYNYLKADQTTTGLNPAMFSNSGKERGHLPQAMLSHKFTKNLDGYLLAEYFIPKNFYNKNANDALFFRWQLQYKF
ncbi:MAG: alginate export family protein [Thermodesulfovibrionales bacterium]|nr:alginate export family protein [Thermodesulfovibrionales bacterium]